jgi:hypothetical protein
MKTPVISIEHEEPGPAFSPSGKLIRPHLLVKAPG